jgi:cell division protein FtsB
MSQPPVDEVLQQIRSGVRQRQAQVATVAAGTEEARHKLVELTSKEYIQEPMAISPRPVLGRLLVFSRKAVFHLFMKWFLRPVLEQQNGFNQTASRLLQDLVQSQEALAKQVRDLSAKVDALERRLREATDA